MSPGSVSKVVSNSAICAVLHIIQQSQACWFVLAGCSKWRRKAFWRPLTILGEEKVLPSSCLFSDRIFQTVSHWNSWRHFLWCRWFPAPWLGKAFPLGRCEIPLLGGSPVPRGQALQGCVQQQELLHYLTLGLAAGPLSTCSQQGSCPRQEVRPEPGFRKSEQRDPHPFEADRNLPSDLMGPTIWL